jgi:PAS domain S-box-containing protein
MDNQFINILLIEDNPGDARLIQEMLKEWPASQFHLTHVKQLAAGLQQLDSDMFDVLLLDLGLPDSQGLETLAQVKTQAPNFPVIILTGLDDTSLGLQAVKAGAQDYLVKGQFDQGLLVRPIHYAIERHHLQQNLLRQANALLQSEARFHHMIEHNADSIIIVDEGGIIRFVNPAAETLFKCKASDLVDQPFDFPLVKGEPVELEIVGDEGSKTRTVVEMRVTETEWGGASAYLASLRDITERKQAEEKILHRNRELGLLNQIIAVSTTDLEPEFILETACHELALAFNVPHVAAVMLNEDKTTATVVAEHRVEGRPSTLHNALPIGGNPLFQHLLRNKTPLVVDDAQSDSRLAPIHEIMRERGIMSLLLLPLVIEGAVVGSLGLDAIEPRQFSAEEVSLAWSVADQVSGALARVRVDQERQRLSMAIEKTAESVVITDSNGSILYVNNAFEQTTGYTKSEVVGQNPRFLNSGKQGRQFYQELWGKITGGLVWAGRLVNQKKDGTFYTTEATISPVKGENGAITNYVSVQRDITRELELEEQYRQVVTSISDHVYVTEATSDGRMINRYVSPNIERLTGYPRDTFENDWGFWSSTVIHPEDGVTAQRQLARLKSGQNSETVYRLVQAGGQVIWVRDSARVHTLGNSRVFYGVVSDITEHIEAEHIIAQRASQLALINGLGRQITAVLELNSLLNTAARLIQETFDYHHVALFLATEAALSLRAVSGSYESYFPVGHTQQLSEGINGWVACHGEKIVANDVQTEPRYTSLIAPYTITQAELCLPIKIGDNTVGVIDIQSPNRNAFSENDVVAMEAIAGQIAVAIENARLYESVQQELVDRKKAEAALAKERASLARRVQERTAELSAANAELARATRLKDEFLANMSHELRTPLNAILGMAEILKINIYGPLNEEQANSVGHIEESGKHLLALINDILDLSKIEAGKLDLAISTVPVRDVCQASLQFIKQAALKKQINIVSSFNQDVTTIQADQRRLKQVLVNLLSNAVKFTPEGGQIGLEFEVDPGQEAVHFTVWDTGIGISAEDLGHLFQPFVQVDSSLSRQFEGTGLGLSLVSRLTQMHGGGIAVESEVGKGSRFIISLPYLQREAQPDEAVPESQTGSKANPTLSTPDEGKAVVLIVEDNEANIIFVRDFLRNRGYLTIEARNGVEAIELAKEERPDIILMDIQMPVLDGTEATRSIREDNELATTPIIALTALAMPGDRERCIAAGADDYMSKPVRLAELSRKIEFWLRQVRARLPN